MYIYKLQVIYMILIEYYAGKQRPLRDAQARLVCNYIV